MSGQVFQFGRKKKQPSDSQDKKQNDNDRRKNSTDSVSIKFFEREAVTFQLRIDNARDQIA